MGFEKNNTLGKGRPKGSTNRTTKQMKDILAIIFNDIHLKTGNEDEVYESTKYMDYR